MLRAGDRVVRVEVDGGVHLSLTQRWRDTAKDNDAALDGRVILRFPSVAIYTDDPVAVRQLRRALGLVSA
jgi:very-short-patch-repair endonuclease